MRLVIILLRVVYWLLAVTALKFAANGIGAYDLYVIPQSLEIVWELVLSFWVALLLTVPTLLLLALHAARWGTIAIWALAMSLGSWLQTNRWLLHSSRTNDLFKLLCMTMFVAACYYAYRWLQEYIADIRKRSQPTAG